MSIGQFQKKFIQDEYNLSTHWQRRSVYISVLDFDSSLQYELVSRLEPTFESTKKPQ